MFLLLFLIIDLYFRVPAVIGQIFLHTVELIIPIIIAAKEARAEIETDLVNAKAKISKC